MAKLHEYIEQKIIGDIGLEWLRLGSFFGSPGNSVVDTCPLSWRGWFSSEEIRLSKSGDGKREPELPMLSRMDLFLGGG
jgi:hypothetical protein